MKILYVTTIGLTMNFFKNLIHDLMNEGHTVDIACNESDRKVDDCYREWGCKVYQIDCSRSPLAIGNLRALKELRSIVKDSQYDIVHCHTPIAGAATRLACKNLRKNGLRVFYTAHGFHFYKGAPIKNWLIYYPIEKFCAYFTDTLITINHEDYELARKKMKAKRVEYVPGVGIDVEKFKNVTVDRAAKRKELGIPEDAFLLLSVGELNKNKNHQIVIRALAKLRNPSVHYMIAGTGDRRDYLLELAKQLGVEDQVHLLGYRTDIAALNHVSDAFCFVSRREGLGLVALEAMACGLPLITSNVHGINDYSQDDVTGYKFAPDDVDGFSSAIRELYCKPDLCIRFGDYNRELVKKYDVDHITKIMMGKIYR